MTSRPSGRRLPVQAGRVGPRMAAIAIPGLLLFGHLTGGANGVVAGLLFAMSASGLGLALLFWERSPVPQRFVSLVIWTGVPAGALMAFVALSALPGSGALGGGRLSELVGGGSLSLDPQATWLEFVKLLGLAATALLAERVASSARRLRQTIWALIWVGGAWTVWALLLLAINAGSTGVTRLSGGFVSPNVAGAVIVITLLLLVGECRPQPAGQGRSSGRDRWIVAALGIVLVAGLALTASRACATLGLSLAAGLWLWPRRGPLWQQARQSRFRSIELRVLIGCGLGAAMLSAGSLVARLPQTGTAAVDRWSILEVYAGAAAQSPLTGHGLGAASALSRLLLTPENYAVFWNVRAAHNLFVQWWVETGLLGVALWGGAMIFLGFRTLTGLGKPGRSAMAGPIAALVFLVLHGQVDYELQIYSVALTAAYLTGLCAAVSCQPVGYWERLARASKGKLRTKRGRGSPNPEPTVKF